MNTIKRTGRPKKAPLTSWTNYHLKISRKIPNNFQSPYPWKAEIELNHLTAYFWEHFHLFLKMSFSANLKKNAVKYMVTYIYNWNNSIKTFLYSDALWNTTSFFFLGLGSSSSDSESESTPSISSRVRWSGTPANPDLLPTTTFPSLSTWASTSSISSSRTPLRWGFPTGTSPENRTSRHRLLILHDCASIKKNIIL